MKANGVYVKLHLLMCCIFSSVYHTHLILLGLKNLSSSMQQNGMKNVTAIRMISLLCTVMIPNHIPTKVLYFFS